MSVQFKAENHQYQSVGEDKIDWVSVTSLMGQFKEPFNGKEMADKVSKNKKSKWFGLTPAEVLDHWSSESKRSMDLGTWYHNQREADITNHNTLERDGVTLPIIKPIYDEETKTKFAPDQTLSDGIYPEHFVYLKSAGICGQSDLVEVVNGTVNILDYKTNKEIKPHGFKGWDGKTKKLQFPLNNLDDCNLNHYTLQLSMYLFIILKHNPKLKAGKLVLHHILFEEQARDKFDNPIYKIDHQGNFIVKDIIPYELPYMKSQCISIINWLKDNRSKLKRK